MTKRQFREWELERVRALQTEWDLEEEIYVLITDQLSKAGVLDEEESDSCSEFQLRNGRRFVVTVERIDDLADDDAVA